MSSPQTWLSMTEQNKGRFEWQNFCHICPTAAEEAPHRKWYCSSGVPGRRHAVCPRHDCLQLLTRLHPRASGRTLLRQHQLQGICMPNLFIHTSQRSSPPLTLLGFDAARVVKLNVRVPHSALKCLIWDTGCLCVVFPPSDTTAGDDGYHQKELLSLTQVTF